MDIIVQDHPETYIRCSEKKMTDILTLIIGAPYVSSDLTRHNCQRQEEIKSSCI